MCFLLGAACSSSNPEAGISIELSTDYPTTELAYVGLYITSDGAPVLSLVLPLAASRFNLPGTFLMRSPKSGAPNVHVFVAGYDASSKAIVLNTGTFVAPTDRYALLRMPLAKANAMPRPIPAPSPDDPVYPNALEDCGPGSTRRGGCVSDAVDVGALPAATGAEGTFPPGSTQL